jgi:HNH endonuclease
MADKGICSVDGCERKAHSRTWCNMHYLRWQKYGDVLHPVEAQVHGGSVLDRFWAKVDRRGPDECWPWKASRRSHGYGVFWAGSKRANGDNIMEGAHRSAYRLLVGPIADGLFVCHKCDNPPCVNPAHLFLGTQLDNMADAVAKGRHVSPPNRRGPHPWSAKVDATTVTRIRELHANGGITQQWLADQYGLSQTAVGEIIRRQSWKHI